VPTPLREIISNKRAGGGLRVGEVRRRRLALKGPLTTHFHRRSGKVSHYREFLFFDDGDLAVAGYEDKAVTRPLRVAGETIFDKEFKAFRVQRRGSTFTTICVYSMDDRLLGYYSDATMPWTGVRRSAGGQGFETDIDDLYLDHWIFPDGRGFVLDLGEMHQGLAEGRISADEAGLALATISELCERHQAATYPHEEFSEIDLDPALLRDLPQSQE
jgi:predicted RNA-binding protein associated with RNAse of E/G family